MSSSNQYANYTADADNDGEINPTVVALEAAEEFIAKMDNAFAEFDQDEHFDLQRVDTVHGEEEEDDDDDDEPLSIEEEEEYEVGSEDKDSLTEADDGDDGDCYAQTTVERDFSSDNTLPSSLEISTGANENHTTTTDMNMNSIAQAIDEIDECRENNYENNNDDVHQNFSLASMSPSPSLSSSSSSSSPLQWQNNSTFSSYNGDFESDIVSPNRGLHVVQEEPEEEEDYDDVKEEIEEDEHRQEEVEEQDQVDTDWGDDNDFFAFTDDEASDEDESLLVSPQPVMIANGESHKPADDNADPEDQPDVDGKQVNTQAKIAPSDPPPQDQPIAQYISMNGNGMRYEEDEETEGDDVHTNPNTNPNQSNHTGDSLPVIDDGDNGIIKHQDSMKSSNLFTSSNETTETSPSSNDATSPTSNQPSPPSCAKTLTYMYVDRSKTDQLAESHAEDVLSLTLEVQTLRDQLKKEREAHEKTRAYLEQEEEKSVRMEVDVQQLRADISIMKEEHPKELEAVQNESDALKNKLQAAEEDYQQALEIAKDSDTQRVEMEGHLKNALDEVENLRVQLQQSHQQLPMISEQQDRGGPECSSDGTSYETPRRMMGRMPTISSNSPYRRDKAIVTIGRNLLRQVADTDDLSTTSASSYDGSTTSNSSYLVTLTRRSAEKRQRLRDSMSRNSDGPVTGREVVCFSSPTSQNGGLDLGYGSAFISTVKAVSKIMKSSGKRLNLGGRWFNSSKSSITMKRKGGNNDSDEMDLESIARNYCRSVEALVSKQRKDVQELQQFCGFLEQKLETI
mmetsp:Transcript_20196/g.30304  ORF Transcript_20196/g.30304 Transcript_20196/m.30304 type:complete len:794 (-) Transcript_20196:2735-5116(-)|eukprot:CAMPEP_0203678740 /NCGR_PEP_ID=MMETSP0090-20130426/33096_1 /ASSEMBLY_ACC=CAM_ASM_001088 /TAXON_ID=426623 /ORGANISM="Chaetoceros affinis, Strain CCMP159" /LENGTH=793 /DNA_ID=CAMNT_0050546121 /DNA_START=126 /DNA_END=2507 /DNA_ORIENTATION=-